MVSKIYTIDEIRSLAVPLCEKYGIEAMYVFGSYARGEATSDSDIDLRIEKGNLKSLFQFSGLEMDLEDTFQKNTDLMTTQMLSESFLNSIRKDEIRIW